MDLDLCAVGEAIAVDAISPSCCPVTAGRFIVNHKFERPENPALRSAVFDVKRDEIVRSDLNSPSSFAGVQLGHITSAGPETPNELVSSRRAGDGRPDEP